MSDEREKYGRCRRSSAARDPAMPGEVLCRISEPQAEHLAVVGPRLSSHFEARERLAVQGWRFPVTTRSAALTRRHGPRLKNDGVVSNRQYR